MVSESVFRDRRRLAAQLGFQIARTVDYAGDFHYPGVFPIEDGQIRETVHAPLAEAGEIVTTGLPRTPQAGCSGQFDKGQSRTRGALVGQVLIPNLDCEIVPDVQEVEPGRRGDEVVSHAPVVAAG